MLFTFTQLRKQAFMMFVSSFALNNGDFTKQLSEAKEGEVSALLQKNVEAALAYIDYVDKNKDGRIFSDNSDLSDLKKLSLDEKAFRKFLVALGMSENVDLSVGMGTDFLKGRLSKNFPQEYVKAMANAEREMKIAKEEAQKAEEALRKEQEKEATLKARAEKKPKTTSKKPKKGSFTEEDLPAVEKTAESISINVAENTLLDLTNKYGVNIPRGQKAKEAQEALNSLGAKLSVDGVFGKNSKIALNKYLPAIQQKAIDMGVMKLKGEKGGTGKDVEAKKTETKDNQERITTSFDKSIENKPELASRRAKANVMIKALEAFINGGNLNGLTKDSGPSLMAIFKDSSFEKYFIEQLQTIDPSIKFSKEQTKALSDRTDASVRKYMELLGYGENFEWKRKIDNGITFAAVAIMGGVIIDMVNIPADVKIVDLGNEENLAALYDSIMNGTEFVPVISDARADMAKTRVDTAENKQMIAESTYDLFRNQLERTAGGSMSWLDKLLLDRSDWKEMKDKLAQLDEMSKKTPRDLTAESKLMDEMIIMLKDEYKEDSKASHFGLTKFIRDKTGVKLSETENMSFPDLRKAYPEAYEEYYRFVEEDYGALKPMEQKGLDSTRRIENNKDTINSLVGILTNLGVDKRELQFLDEVAEKGPTQKEALYVASGILMFDIKAKGNRGWENMLTLHPTLSNTLTTKIKGIDAKNVNSILTASRDPEIARYFETLHDATKSHKFFQAQLKAYAKEQPAKYLNSGGNRYGAKFDMTRINDQSYLSEYAQLLYTTGNSKDSESSLVKIARTLNNASFEGGVSNGSAKGNVFKDIQVTPEQLKTSIANGIVGKLNPNDVVKNYNQHGKNVSKGLASKLTTDNYIVGKPIVVETRVGGQLSRKVFTPILKADCANVILVDGYGPFEYDSQVIGNTTGAIPLIVPTGNGLLDKVFDGNGGGGDNGGGKSKDVSTEPGYTPGDGVTPGDSIATPSGPIIGGRPLVIVI